MIQIFWGDGRGKTTAALGTGMRAAGRGLKIHMIQFMKRGPHEKPGELMVLNNVPNFTYECFGAGFWLAGKPTEGHRIAAKRALHAAQTALSSGAYDLVILDEVLYAFQASLIKIRDLTSTLQKRHANTEVILTGGHKKPPPTLLKMADLVTHMKKIKHPFDKGEKARKGIEY